MHRAQRQSPYALAIITFYFYQFRRFCSMFFYSNKKSIFIFIIILYRCRCSYYYTTNYYQLLITDCPGSVNITSSSNSSLKAGDVLTCVSDAMSEPRYTWTDSGGVVVSTCRSITLNTYHSRLTCTAASSLNASCAASKSISVTIDMDGTWIRSKPLIVIMQGGAQKLEHPIFILILSTSHVYVFAR